MSVLTTFKLDDELSNHGLLVVTELVAVPALNTWISGPGHVQIHHLHSQQQRRLQTMGLYARNIIGVSPPMAQLATMGGRLQQPPPTPAAKPWTAPVIPQPDRRSRSQQMPTTPTAKPWTAPVLARPARRGRLQLPLTPAAKLCCNQRFW